LDPRHHGLVQRQEALPRVQSLPDLLPLLFQPRSHLLQLIGQVVHRRPDQLPLLVVFRLLDDDLSVLDQFLQPIGDGTDLGLDLLEVFLEELRFDGTILYFQFRIFDPALDVFDVVEVVRADGPSLLEFPILLIHGTRDSFSQKLQLVQFLGNVRRYQLLGFVVFVFERRG
jgi:hypothetical protein